MTIHQSYVEEKSTKMTCKSIESREFRFSTVSTSHFCMVTLFPSCPPGSCEFLIIVIIIIIFADYSH